MSEQIKLSISGMACAACVSAVEKGLMQVDGVEQAEVNLNKSSATVTGSASTEVLITAVKEAGYDATEIA